MNAHEITFNTNASGTPRTRADFTYDITPATISITDTGMGKRQVIDDLEAVLRKIEYWHQGSISSFKIMCRDSKGFWHRVQRDGKTAVLFALEVIDERKALKKLFLYRGENE